MAAESPSSARPLESMDELIAPFHAAEKPAHKWRVGTEAEKIGVHLDGRATNYDVDIRGVLDRLVEQHGWFGQAEWEGGDVIQLNRGAANITLEPGGQLELSGAPLDTVHQTCAEFRGHVAELQSVGDALGVRWLGLGFHPLARQADLPWVPKLRYGVMREYLPTKGSMALDMMRRTCTVQANLDYSDVEDAFSKLRIGLRLQPIITAMFANSPWVEGVRTGQRSRRAEVWLHMDPDRCGLLEQLWDGPPSYERYVEWALDVPMFGIKRGGSIKPTHQTFRTYWKDGHEGLTATRADWDAHVNSLFPETRLKNIVEMRGADGQSSSTLCGLPALWKGLLYDAETRRRAESLAGKIQPADLHKARLSIPVDALHADLGGRKVSEWAGDVLELAESGLARLGHLDGQGRDERVFLRSLRDLLEKEQTPADLLLEKVPAERPDVADVLEAAAF